jgi:hypothetical protein
MSKRCRDSDDNNNDIAPPCTKRRDKRQSNPRHVLIANALRDSVLISWGNAYIRLPYDLALHIAAMVPPAFEATQLDRQRQCITFRRQYEFDYARRIETNNKIAMHRTEREFECARESYRVAHARVKRLDTSHEQELRDRQWMISLYHDGRVRHSEIPDEQEQLRTQQQISRMYYGNHVDTYYNEQYYDY